MELLLPYGDPRETTTFNRDHFRYLLGIGEQLLKGVPCEDYSYYGSASEFGKQYSNFSEINDKRPHIRAALALPEPEATDNLSSVEEWPPSQMVRMLDGLLGVTLAAADISNAIRKSERARGAYNVQHRIGQIASINGDHLYRLALSDHLDIAGPARRLLAHGEIVLPSLAADELPKMLPFVGEVVSHELSYLTPDKIGIRLASIIRQTALTGQKDALDELFATLQECNLPEAVLAYTARYVPSSEEGFKATALSDIRALAELEDLYRKPESSTPNIAKEQSANMLVDQYGNSSAPIALRVKKEVIRAFADEPRMLSAFLDRCYDIDLGTLEHAWMQSLGDKHDPRIKSYRAANVRMIVALETAHPGSVNQLMQKFRIRSFARYPFEVLKQQYLSSVEDIPEEPQEKPQDQEQALVNQWYVADYDHSAAFSNMHRKSIGRLASAIWHTGQKFEIREVNSADQIAQSVSDAQTEIGLLFLTAHSDGDRALLSRQRALDQHEIMQNQFTQLTGRFAVDAMVIMSSCHTGKPGKLGETISDTLNVHVWAPTSATSLVGFQISPPPRDSALTTPLSVRPTYDDDPGRLITPRRTQSRSWLQTIPNLA